MAVKVKREQHGTNTLSGIGYSSADLTKIIAPKNNDNEKEILESEQNVHKANMDDYTAYDTKFSNTSDLDRCLIMSTLHQRAVFLGWTLGGFLKLQKEEIESGKSNYVSWNHFFTVRERELGFSRQAADNYIKLNSNFTIEEYRRLGTRVCLELTRIKDEEQRKAAKTAFLRSKPTAEEAREVVTKKIGSIEKDAKSHRESEKKRILRKHPYSVESAGKTKDGRILVKVDPEDHGAMLAFLSNKEFEIKRYLETYNYSDQE